MHSCGFSVPQLSTTIIGYHSLNKMDYINCIKFILCNRHKWNIQEKFREGIPDEIIFACLFGLYSYRPQRELTAFLHNSGKVDMENKNIE
jgi:hypothetical protein